MADLTPEEKEKIYEEEKVRAQARKEAEEAVKSEKTEKPKKSKTSCTAMGCAVLIGIFVIAGIVGSFLDDDSSKSKSTTAKKVVKKEVVYNSEWDAGVYQVEAWLKKNVKDPKSLEFIEWSSVSKKNDGTFAVRVKYRAKNSFGGYVVANQIFMLDAKGNVTGTLDF